MLEVGTNKQSVTAKMETLMQGMLSNLKETAKSILVSQTIGTHREDMHTLFYENYEKYVSYLSASICDRYIIGFMYE
jgi:hypothetical protein